MKIKLAQHLRDVLLMDRTNINAVKEVVTKWDAVQKAQS